MLDYIIWNGSPELFSIGSFSLRWYGLLFATGFLISQQILYYIFKKEGKPKSDVDILTIYMVVATLIGARLGHILFYQPEMLWNDPLGIFLPFKFTPTFHFTGLQGLASHGGAFGILFALWLYSRKKKLGQNYLQTLDRIVIVVALTGCLIRLGNFFNSEIIGKPTDIGTGVVFVKSVTNAITQDQSQPNLIESIRVEKNKEDASPVGEGRKPMYMLLSFKPGISRNDADQYINSVVKFYLSGMGQYVELPAGTGNLNYELSEKPGKIWVATIDVLGIARHPAQLYEATSSLLLFLLLFWIWSRKRENTRTGIIFGIFLVTLWTLRFSYEFLKENQSDFEEDLFLNMGQILSIPLIIAGIIILIKYSQPRIKQ